MLQTTTLLLCGFIFGFSMWTNCEFRILFMVFFWFGEATVVFSLVIATIIVTREQASLISYSIILANILIEMIFSDVDFVFRLFYTDQATQLVYPRLLLEFFQFFPSFTFSVAFGIISKKASKSFNHNT